jgi:hypothetical protein
MAFVLNILKAIVQKLLAMMDFMLKVIDAFNARLITFVSKAVVSHAQLVLICLIKNVNNVHLANINHFQGKHRVIYANMWSLKIAPNV